MQRNEDVQPRRKKDQINFKPDHKVAPTLGFKSHVEGVSLGPIADI